MKKGKVSSGCLMALAGFSGVVLSGQAASWGAKAAGHDSRAGDPFPDFWGMVLFVACAISIPAVIALIIGLIRHIPIGGFSKRLPIPLAVLIVGPLIGWAVGYNAQLGEVRKVAQQSEFEMQQQEAYRRCAAQIIADPMIGLRERWFESKPASDPSKKAEGVVRPRVFEHSFQVDHLMVPYTADQLREIYEQVPEVRRWIAGNAMCPPKLIEETWPLVAASPNGGDFLKLINNPATPRHLLESYLAERRSRPDYYPNYEDKKIEERLKRAP